MVFFYLFCNTSSFFLATDIPSCGECANRVRSKNLTFSFLIGQLIIFNFNYTVEVKTALHLGVNYAIESNESPKPVSIDFVFYINVVSLKIN
jgi:hypothetical protein